MRTRYLLPLALLCLNQCAGIQQAGYTADESALAMLPADSGGFDDGRGRFREIFCSILEGHGQGLKDYRTCEEALTRVGEESPPTGLPVRTGQSNEGFLVGLVPGLGWQCVKNWLKQDNYVPLHVAQHGYDLRLFDVDGLSSTENNALQIRDHVLSLSQEDEDRPLILMGHSKGTVDILQAVVSYPEVSSRVVAVVSLAGAVGGSPLSETMQQSHFDRLAHVPRSGCEPGDSGALASLNPDLRQQWLAGNSLPNGIRYYSVIAYPDPKHVSSGLKSTYLKLAEMDARNDGRLIFYDQFIPGATLLAFANADHLAISTPVARQFVISQSTFANKSDYPRAALLEAILRYVEEDITRSE